MSDEREPIDQEPDTSVSRLYTELSREEPPAHLDAAILAAARKAVRSTPRAADRPRVPVHWQALAAVAAVLLVSLLLVPAMLQEEQLATRPRAADETAGAAGGATPAAPAETAPAPAPAAAVRSRSLEEKASGLMNRENRRAAGEPGRAAGALMAPAREAAKQDMAPVPAAAPPALEDWLAEIRHLLDQGQGARAAQALAALRRTYPDAPIDPALLRRLGPGTGDAGVQSGPPAVE